MIVLYIILALMLLIGALLALPIKVTLDYKESIRLSVSLFGIGLWDHPKPKKKVNLSHYSNKAVAKRRRRLEEKQKKKQPKKKKSKTTPQTPNQKMGPLEGLGQIRKQLSAILSRSVKHVRIEVDRFIIRVAGEDAAETAILFGAVNQAAVGLLSFLSEAGKLKRLRKSRLSVTADFTAQKSVADIRISLTMRLWQIADILLHTPLVYEKLLPGSTSHNTSRNSNQSSKSNQ